MAILEIAEENRVARVRMNRPDVRNAFNTEMIAELTKAFLSFEKRKDLRLVTLSGEGKVFSAGADLSWMKDMVKFTYEQNREDSLRLHAMFDAISRCSVPVLAQVHGAAIGGAMGLMACCDYVIAEEKTQFCFSEVKLGIAPAVISDYVLKKAVPGVVRPLMISGQLFFADTALRSGLIHHIAADGQSKAELDKAVAAWCEAGPNAARETKRLVSEVMELNPENRVDRTTRLIAELRIGTEGQEGLNSFLEKRAPDWRDA